MLLALLLACSEPTCDSGMKFNLEGLCVEDTGRSEDPADADADADSDADTDSGTDTSALDSGANGEMLEERGGIVDWLMAGVAAMRGWMP